MTTWSGVQTMSKFQFSLKETTNKATWRHISDDIDNLLKQDSRLFMEKPVAE
jgi:hypothetical protein